jgi:hypothetical protein
MKPYQHLLNRLNQLDGIVSSILSDINKLKADVEYIAMMTDTEIIIKGDETDEQKSGV